MPTTIRTATTSDLPALGRLGATLMRQHHGFDRHRFMAPGDDPEATYADFLARQLDDPQATVLVAEREGCVVGYTLVAIEPTEFVELREQCGYIHDLAVDEDQRGGGIGSLLLDAALAWIAARGETRAMLWSAFPNTGAQRLFERRGFRRTMVEMSLELRP